MVDGVVECVGWGARHLMKAGRCELRATKRGTRVYKPATSHLATHQLNLQWHLYPSMSPIRETLEWYRTTSLMRWNLPWARVETNHMTIKSSQRDEEMSSEELRGLRKKVGYLPQRESIDEGYQWNVIAHRHNPATPQHIVKMTPNQRGWQPMRCDRAMRHRYMPNPGESTFSS